MDELAKHIEQSLKERGFCVVLEDQLERCWPSENVEDAEREEQIQTFAESRGWIVSVLTGSGVMRAIFEGPAWRLKKRSHQEWRELIRAELKGKGRNRHCSATCPICLISYDVEVLSNDISTCALAVGKVASHLNSAHADAFTDCD
jgi:hypothetical protein